MRLCRVKGTVVSTAKHPVYEGQKLLVVQPVDEQGREQGHSFLAVDRVQAGEGDLVLVNSEGNGARQLIPIQLLPIRSLILGVVDQVDAKQSER
jgi:ethanolamine utilization protein EutN